MPEFGKTSRERLNGVHPSLRAICQELIKKHDFSIVYGLRTPEEQAELYAANLTKTLNSKHLIGRAVDIAPYPIDWNNTKRFYYLAGLFIATADSMGVKIRWGGDWDSDDDLDDQKFFDLLHFELVE